MIVAYLDNVRVLENVSKRQTVLDLWKRRFLLIVATPEIFLVDVKYCSLYVNMKVGNIDKRTTRNEIIHESCWKYQNCFEKS